MAISALVAVGDIAEELVGNIAARAAELHTGEGLRGFDMSPLVSAAHLEKV
ncbi:hypothetical protein [Arthrobacter alpinus]|uniref:hypothetical protein n=1 Tax=Arthrobacter alpinus TaxID=656366 RepID=UPI0021BD347F|nr:hypothetical protein [Arthrobacter alpinus]